MIDSYSSQSPYICCFGGSESVDSVGRDLVVISMTSSSSSLSSLDTWPPSTTLFTPFGFMPFTWALLDVLTLSSSSRSSSLFSDPPDLPLHLLVAAEMFECLPYPLVACLWWRWIEDWCPSHHHRPSSH